MAANQLARLLQPPVTAQWRDIGQVAADARTGEMFLRLPLTELNLWYEEVTAHVEFLPQLTQLTVLTLRCPSDDGGWFIPADAVLTSLVLCTHITQLDLHCGFNSAHWSALFAKLTIKKLTVRGDELDTLQCFAAGPITHSLEELCVYTVELPPAELTHLYGLRRLRTLDLLCCFTSHLDVAMIDRISPPTPLLPALKELYHNRQSVERHDPSFEWMQQRRTHSHTSTVHRLALRFQ